MFSNLLKSIFAIDPQTNSVKPSGPEPCSCASGKLMVFAFHGGKLCDVLVCSGHLSFTRVDVVTL